MKFTFNTKKAAVSDELKDYAIKKLNKLDRFFDKDSDATVKFRIERGRHTAEVTVQSERLCFRAEETTNDMYASIDKVVSVIERQIRKNKTQLEKRLHEGAFDKSAFVSAEPMEPEDDYELVRRKRFDVNLMSVEEAILRMNLLNHEFFFFKNAENNGCHSVVYRRHDKGYGIIESEQ